MKYTLEGRQGVSYNQRFQYKQSNGDGFDLSGCTVTMRVKLDEFIHSMTVSIDDASQGIFTASATAEEMSGFPLFSPPCKYDVVLTQSPDVTILLEGDFIVREGPIS